MAELIAARDGATRADMVELRLDGVEDVNVRGALVGRRLPVIVTCRAAWEGGHFDGSEERRTGDPARSARCRGGASIDVEWRAGVPRTSSPRDPSRVVVSSHDFGGVPPVDLAGRAVAMRQTGAAVIKMAVDGGEV